MMENRVIFSTEATWPWKERLYAEYYGGQCVSPHYFIGIEREGIC
jgi:hypothetical protein